MRDPHSFSRPDEAVVRHLSLDLDVDFEAKTLRGTARLEIDRKAGAHELVLDTRDLTIGGVEDQHRRPLEWKLGPVVQHLGRALTIGLAGDTRVVTIAYATSPDAAAVQWLAPSQTAGGIHPFLFTQSQAILARSWVPCQDSPGVRMTYDATVRVPTSLMALMSAENPMSRSEDGVYRFRMPQRIPSYLLALAVGDLEFRSLGRNCGVYAEKPVIDGAAWELEGTQAMIDAAERLYGPYQWGRYDVLILPPSFPFGGMENPRLTFATPTMLAGDRSLVNLIAHELAHSWSGNLVTNATWNDFWLNEGFTVYFERRIMQEIEGRGYSEMLAVLGMQDLEQVVSELGAGSPDTQLLLDLEGRDPDEAATKLPYEKGYFLLRLIEETVGRPAFDIFLRGWFERNAFESRTTRQFVAELRHELLDRRSGAAEKIGLARWIDGPGIPHNVPRPNPEAFVRVEEQAKAFVDGTSAGRLSTQSWSTHEWIHFLRKLPQPLTHAQIEDLDRAFSFTASGNAEILNEWLLHTIAADWRPSYEALEKFLLRQGRRKFLKPLYSKLAETDEGFALARRIYERARPTYHSVSFHTIDAILAEKRPVTAPA